MLAKVALAVLFCRWTAVVASQWLPRSGFGNRILTAQGKLELPQSTAFSLDFSDADGADDVENMTSQLLNQLQSSSMMDDVEDTHNSRPQEAASMVRDLQWHGTTTLAFKHNDSIIVCVDSKASTGEYIASKTVKKVIPITESIVATMAGGAADCYHNIRRVGTLMKIEEATMGLDITVKAAAKLLQSIVLSKSGPLLLVTPIDRVIGSHRCPMGARRWRKSSIRLHGCRYRCHLWSAMYVQRPLFSQVLVS